MSGKLIMVTGGSRSGKSEFAEKLVRKLGEKCAYIATALVCDEEMRLRVIKHKKRREDDFWVNYEVPFDAHKVFEDLKSVDIVLFDCITIYITNILYNDSEELNITEKYDFVVEKIKQLLHSAKSSGKTVVFVTNELGSGIVPFEPELRGFRDLAGLANQIIAEKSDDVYVVIAGIPVELKALSAKMTLGGN